MAPSPPNIQIRKIQQKVTGQRHGRVQLIIYPHSERNEKGGIGRPDIRMDKPDFRLKYELEPFVDLRKRDSIFALPRHSNQREVIRKS